MKKTISLFLGVALLALAGCGSTAASSSQSAAAAAPESSTAPATNTPDAQDKVFKIGVLQLEAHAALDAAYAGFEDALVEAGYVDGDNIKIDYKNAQGEIANCPTIASKLVNDKNDLILAIATPAAQAVANATTDIPVLFTAVTDPVAAKLVQSVDLPGGNVTGTSDLTPVAAQMDLLRELVPTAQKVGFLYCSSEANSIAQVEIAKAAAVELGLEYEDFTVSNTNELQSVVTSMAGKVDAIYVPTDNLVAKAMPTVASIAIEQKLPLIVGEEYQVTNGGLASVSISYYELGRITGLQAVEILNGEAKPAEMPVRYQEQFERVFNPDTAAALGITIPDDFTGMGDSAPEEAASSAAE